MKGLFWGIFLMGTGVFLLIKHYLNLNVSTARFVLGFFLICIGLSVLFGGGAFRQNENRFVFSEGNALITKYTEKEHNIIFGSGTIDFSSVEDNNSGRVEINIVFGNGRIILPTDRKVVIEANSVMASTTFPDNTDIVFGEKKYEQGPGDSEKGTLFIELNTVFGKAEIIK